MIKFFVFGLPHFEDNGLDLNFRRSKGLALTAYLVATRRAQSRDVLAELLWPEFSLETARANLRRELSILNKLLGNETFIADRSQVVFNAESAIEIDLYHFWKISKIFGSTTQKLDSEAIMLVENTLPIYTDDFLAGFAVHGSAEFDDWRYFEAESIRRAYASMLQSLIGWFSQAQDYTKAIHYARIWLALDPLYETAQRQVINLLASAGNYADALRQYQSCERLLRDELDVLPEPETTKLYEAIRSRQFFSQEVSPSKPIQLQHNLPSQMTQFVGREKELAELHTILQNRDSRLLTIVAAGGMGKTRLALEIGQNYLKNYQYINGNAPQKQLSGIYFIDLSPLSDATNIVQTTANTIACPIQGDGRSVRQQVLDYLRDKTMLLIFDNYEHLLEDALFMSEIYQNAPSVQILVTSREALNLQEEKVFRISGMDTPDKDTSENWRSFSAVELFINNARRVKANFVLEEQDREAVLKICNAVVGMPLGIILASPWLDTLTLNELADEIKQSLDFLSTDARNLAPRHRSIRAVFEPSWQRLDDAERDIFMCLSVFRAGFTAQAAKRILGASIPQLAKLLKKSLIQRDMSTGRYSIHELLRQYAQEHLEASGKAAEIHQAHSSYYLEWLASLEEDLKGRRQLAALDEIELDIDNIRAAWHWAGQERDFPSISRAMTSNYHFHDMHSYHYEFKQSLNETIAQLAQPENEEEAYVISRLRIYVAKLNLFNFLDTQADNLTVIEEHLRLAHKRNDLHAIAYVSGMKAWLVARTPPYTKDAEARKLMMEAIAIHRQLGDYLYLSEVLISLAMFEFDLLSPANETNFARIHELLQEAVRLQREIGDGHGRIWSLNAMPMLSFVGQYKEVIEYLKEMQDLAHLYKSRYALTQSHSNLSFTYFLAGDFAAAWANLDELSRLSQETHYRNFEGTIHRLTCYRLAMAEQYTELRAFIELHPFMDQRQLLFKLIASCGQADYETAKHELDYLRKLQPPTHLPDIFMLSAIATIIVANTSNPNEGLEILAYILSQTKGLVGWINKWPLVGRLLTKLEADLGQDAYKQAWANSKALDLETMMQKLQILLE